MIEEGLFDIQGIHEFKPDPVTLMDVQRVHFCVPDPWKVMTESHFISAGGAKTIADAVMKKKIEKGVFFSTIGNEFMVNTQKELNLSQLRTYAMLGYQLSKSTNIQFGYMYISRPSADNLHRLQFFLTQKFKFYKTPAADL